MGMAGEDGEWAVAYHGTAMKTVPLIIDNGFRAGGSAGVVKDCEDTRTGKPCGTGAIFCTPNLTTVECYANGNEDVASDQKDAAAEIDGHTLFFAFQCRVRPSAIRRPSRHFALNNDEEVMGPRGVFEWIVNSPDDIRPYGILVREKHCCDHRILDDLICNVDKSLEAQLESDTDWNGKKRHNSKRLWNIDNKPFPLGHFDCIPGWEDPLRLGMRVEARQKGGERYYPGKITRVHPARSSGYDISYDDGEFEACVQAGLIRPTEAQSSPGSRMELRRSHSQAVEKIGPVCDRFMGDEFLVGTHANWVSGGLLHRWAAEKAAAEKAAAEKAAAVKAPVAPIGRPVDWGNSYNLGDIVEYKSATLGKWFATKIIRADEMGVQVHVKPGVYIPPHKQATFLRHPRAPPASQIQWPE
jgi:hypothetical protein